MKKSFCVNIFLTYERLNKRGFKIFVTDGQMNKYYVYFERMMRTSNISATMRYIWATASSTNVELFLVQEVNKDGYIAPGFTLSGTTVISITVKWWSASASWIFCRRGSDSEAMRSLIGFLVVVGVQCVAIGGQNMFSMHLLEDNFGPPLKTDRVLWVWRCNS